MVCAEERNLLPIFWFCCNLSIGVALNLRFTTNGMCAKNNIAIYMARTSTNGVIAMHDLYCCLLSQCEALCTCRSGFPLATKWCCDQDVKVVPSAAFTKRMCDRCGSHCKKEVDVVAASPLVLHWMCDSSWMGCAWRATRMYTWREQAIIEQLRRMISIVACCHSVKLCALTAQAFRSLEFVLFLCSEADISLKRNVIKY